MLCAPTAFGKTVMAAALIAARKTNTLIIVHRTQLLAQWRNRLSAFLNIDDRSMGTIGAGKRSPTGTIDIAVMQSLVRKGVVQYIVGNYGQVIVDECHHVSAFSFEPVMKEAKARFVLGLTATPLRLVQRCVARSSWRTAPRSRCSGLGHRSQVRRRLVSSRPMSGQSPPSNVKPCWNARTMDLSISLKNAKALDITIPQLLLLRADEVIQ